MLIQPTLDKLNALKLNGMAIALSDQMTHGAAQGLAFEERLALLLDRESLYRENRRMTRLEQLAQFKQRAALEDLNYRDRTGLDRSQIAGTCRVRLDPRESERLDPRRNRQWQEFFGVCSRASSLSQRLERTVRARTAAVRGTDPLPCRRELPQAPRRHRQDQRVDHRRFCDRPHRTARAQRSARVDRRSRRDPILRS